MEERQDLISRQAAVDMLMERASNLRGTVGDLGGACSGAAKLIAQFPSAEPKTGRWILDRSGAYCCSKCMEPCAGYVMMKPRDKFCKMCGAKMEGADDE